jgi:two-component system, response regulator PdtaR
MDIELADLDGIDVAVALHQTKAVPIILVLAGYEAALLERALVGPNLAFLVKPVKLADLAGAILLVRKRLEQMLALQQEAADLRQALQERKLIERAKGAIMQRAGVEEAEAHRRLSHLATAHHLKQVQMAQWVLMVAEAFAPPEP